MSQQDATDDATDDTAGAGQLRASGLTVELRIAGQWTKAVDDVDLCIRPGETVGVVGESGAGKSVTAMALARLLPPHVARVTAGSVFLDDQDLLTLSRKRIRQVRGGEIGMIFQEPRRSLDPAFTVGDQIAEGVRAHGETSRREAWVRAVDMLQRVGIPDPEKRAKEYPHTFSGGMCQRVMLAVALASRPRFLIADEPTTALDVTVQAQVLDLLKDLQEEMGLGMLFITHDLGVIAEISDRVAVMYAGQVVENGATSAVLNAPEHPYTAALLAGVPDVDAVRGSLAAIPGAPPGLGAWAEGCRFAPRCGFRIDECSDKLPPLARLESGQASRCIRAVDLDLEGVRR